MGRNPGLVYVRDTSGKLVRVKPLTKPKAATPDKSDRAILESGAATSDGSDNATLESRARTPGTKRGRKHRYIRSEKLLEKQNIKGEKNLIEEAVLDELDRTILESGVKTPAEAHEKKGILLMVAEARMTRSIPAIFGVETFAEAQKIYLNRLPVKI